MLGPIVGDVRRLGTTRATVRGAVLQYNDYPFKRAQRVGGQLNFTHAIGLANKTLSLYCEAV